MVDALSGRGQNPHYLGYFMCFNQQMFFEAHEVLETLWLNDRSGPNGAFYKGLIQLAGAFVHWQKNRPGPAAALFRLAESNLRRYPATHEQLDIQSVLRRIQDWIAAVEHGINPLESSAAPRLDLIEPRS